MVRRAGRARPPAAGDHRPLAARRAADGRRGARPRGRLQRLHLQPPRAARGARARRARLRLDERHGGAAQGLGGVGRGDARPPRGDVRLRAVGARERGGSCSPATGSGSSRSTSRTVERRAALRLDAAGARGRRRRRHRRSTRSRCTTTCRCTRSCRRRGRSCAACASSRPRPCWSSSPTARGASGAGGTRPSRATRRGRTGRRATGRRRCSAALTTAVERRMVADVPVGVLLSGGLDSSLIAALLARGEQREPGDVLDRLPRRRRPRGRRVRVLRPDGARARHGAPPDPRRRRTGWSTRCPTRSGR